MTEVTTDSAGTLISSPDFAAEISNAAMAPATINNSQFEQA